MGNGFHNHVSAKNIASHELHPQTPQFRVMLVEQKAAHQPKELQSFMVSTSKALCYGAFAQRGMIQCSMTLNGITPSLKESCGKGCWTMANQSGNSLCRWSRVTQRNSTICQINKKKCGVPITLFVRGVVVKFGGATNHLNVIHLSGSWLLICDQG